MYKRLLLSLLACLFICGCSDRTAARKRLSSDAEKLTYQFLDMLLYEQIKLNNQSSSKAYCISPDRIWLINFDGVELYPVKSEHADLKEYAVARHYVGQELCLNVPSVIVGGLIAIKHKRFSFRSSLEIKISEQRRIWKHTPGMPIKKVFFKQDDKPEAHKQLLSVIPDALPDEIADLQALYQRPSEVKENSYVVNVFICYDPSLPGWVFEDEQFRKKVSLPGAPAEWSRQAFYPAGKMPQTVKEYNKELYWQDSALIRSNYDKKMVYRWNKWLKTNDAEEIKKFKDFCQKFDPRRSDLPGLTAFMDGLTNFSPAVDRQEAWNLASACSRQLIGQWSNNSQYKELLSFRDLLQNDPRFKPLQQFVLAECQNAVDLVKRRHNQVIDSTLKRLDAAAETLTETVKRTGMSAMQINIVFERLRNNLAQDKAIDSAALCDTLYKINYCMLLKHGYIDEAADFISVHKKGRLLAEIRKQVRKRCTFCNRGRKDCLHCVQSPGQCKQCKGEVLDKAGKICQYCKGDGKCLNCHGELKIDCLRCKGRSFVIINETVEKNLQGNIAMFRNLREKQVIDQMDKRYER